MQEEQIRDLLDAHWRASAAGDAAAEHDIYEDDVICDYPNRASGSLDEAIWKRCEVIILANHQGSTSGGFSGKVISGLRNTPSPIGTKRHTQSASWSSATAR